MKKLIGVTMIALVVVTLSGFTTPAFATTVKKGVTATVAKVNINKATAAELTAIKGIGAKKAEAIVEFRKKNGDFQKLEDLMLVKGIGEKIFQKIKSQITIQ